MQSLLGSAQSADCNLTTKSPPGPKPGGTPRAFPGRPVVLRPCQPAPGNRSGCSPPLMALGGCSWPPFKAGATAASLLIPNPLAPWDFLTLNPMNEAAEWSHSLKQLERAATSCDLQKEPGRTGACAALWL